jgi:phosphoribosyl 1,2-cyclic phosphodiesterase
MYGFCPLASGSKGNALYVGTRQTKILIDAGISGRQVKLKLEQIGVDLSEIEAIVVTHEHSDHITGLKTLAFRHGIPVFANSETAKGITRILGDCPKFKIFTTGETFEFGDLEVHPFSIQHDTLDPVAFTIRTGDQKLGICADLGFVTNLVRHRLQECDMLYVEANHQPSMVHACPRPMVYKQRVLSRHGHLSNPDCGTLIADVWHPGLKQVYLAHLSSECNSEETALSVVTQVLSERGLHVDLNIAFQDRISRPYAFEHTAHTEPTSACVAH